MDALEQYIHDHTSPEEELLHELDRATNLRVVQPRMTHPVYVLSF